MLKNQQLCVFKKRPLVGAGINDGSAVMHLAIISTTIRGEKGYLPYDRLAPKSKFSKVSFVISGDLNSSTFDVSKFQSYVAYLDAGAQKKYASSEAIGWNKYARRNIALLRAIELKPDYILTIDDDNIPAGDYFDKWYEVITTPVGLAAQPVKEADAHWHNYLETSDADIKIYPRGFPIPYRREPTTAVKTLATPIPPEKIGVFQGISLGDPDIDAQTRIVYPKPTPLSVIHEKNYCLKNVWSPYNTQNTMFSKKIFPLAFTWPSAGRFEDIYASFVWQKFLFNNDMYAHIGDAVNVQDRGIRNDLLDLEKEVEGYLKGHEVWQEINSISEKEPLVFLSKLMACRHPIIQREREFMAQFQKDFLKII